MAQRFYQLDQDKIKQKIKASQLVNRLQDHALGKIDLSPTQIQAIRILLDKAISDAPKEISGVASGPIEIKWAG